MSAVCVSDEHVPHARFSFFQLLPCIHIMFNQMSVECEVSVAVECATRVWMNSLTNQNWVGFVCHK